MRSSLMAAVVLTFVASGAFAQDRAKLNEFATKLGVSKWTLFGCVRGAGGRPSESASQEQRKVFARAMYECVSAKNPQLTPEQFRAALLEMRQ